MRFTLALVICQPLVAHPLRGQTANGKSQTNHSLAIFAQRLENVWSAVRLQGKSAVVALHLKAGMRLIYFQAFSGI
jgi:hypothetical protein